jgi:hypothetical protein
MLTRALDRIENTHIDQDPETYHRVVKGPKQQRPPRAAAEAKKQAPNLNGCWLFRSRSPTVGPTLMQIRTFSISMELKKYF